MEDALVFLIFAAVALLLIFVVAAVEDAIVLQMPSFAVVAPVDIFAIFALRCR